MSLPSLSARALRGRAAKLTAIALMMLTTMIPMPATGHAQTTLCSPVMVVPIRGSGESVGSNSPTPGTYGETTTLGWEGPTNARLLRKLYDSHPEIREVPVLDVPAPAYPSVPVQGFSELVSSARGSVDRSRVYASSQKGTSAAMRVMADAIKSQPLSCPVPKFILIGYSQGAMVARQVAVATKDLGLVAGVFLAGDPYQKARATGVHGTGAGGNGIYRTSYPGMESTFDKYYSSGSYKVASVCHEFDPVCFSGNDEDVFADPLHHAPHLNYYSPGVMWQLTDSIPDTVTEVDKFAEAIIEVVRDVRSSTPVPTGPYVRSVAKDTVFAIDTTGSMYGLIYEARVAAAALASRLVSADGRSRVGLVEYRDHGDDFVARTVVPLGRDLDAFQSALDGLYPDGGGDTPEAVYSGIAEALRAPWNPVAARSIVVMGDAPAHNPEPVTGFTYEMVMQAMKGVGDLVPMPMARASQPEGGTGDRSQGPSSPAETNAERNAPPADSATLRPYAERTVGLPSTVSTPAGLPVSLYALSTDSQLTEQMRALSDATGGEVHSLSGSAEVVDAITSALDHIDERPVPIVVQPGILVAGSDGVLDCSLSIAVDGAPLVSADIDGDGTYETVCRDGVLDVSFANAGEHVVRVRAVDSAGRAGDSLTTVIVVGAEVAGGGTAPGSGDGSLPVGSTGSAFTAGGAAGFGS